MSFDFVVSIFVAMVMLFIGFGQGLAFNVKDFTFKKGSRLCMSELVLVALAVFLFTRDFGLVAIVDGFLAAGTLLGFLTTRHERPVKDLGPWTPASKIDTGRQDPRITRSEHRRELDIMA